MIIIDFFVWLSEPRWRRFGYRSALIAVLGAFIVAQWLNGDLGVRHVVMMAVCLGVSLTQDWLRNSDS